MINKGGLYRSAVKIDQVSLRGNGALILTGPSSCGKGEVAATLRRVMSIPQEAHLSMGEILRVAATKSRNDAAYKKLLSQQYGLHSDIPLVTTPDMTEDLKRKITEHQEGLHQYFQHPVSLEKATPLQWLEYCVMNGLLVPNRWTQELIAAHIENEPELRKKPFILDGYPRTVKAAQHLIEFLKRLDIPIIKVLHLSISKQEMLSRARQRGRVDDDEKSLAQRFQFYIESVQPSVDYLKVVLGPETIALIDAHQPVFHAREGNTPVFDLQASILNVVADSLRSLGVPRVVLRDILEM